jgi:phage/plasmid primase-like uncharacterized protein
MHRFAFLPPPASFSPPKAPRFSAGCSNIHVGNSTIAACARKKLFRFPQIISNNGRGKSLGNIILDGDGFANVLVSKQI